MEEKKTTVMEFGKSYRVGNYKVLKFTKTLSKRDMLHLREDIPSEIKKHLQRGGIPYIKVEAISGLWSISYSIGTAVYSMLDTLIPNEENTTMFAHLFNMWFMDTSVPGDSEYQNAKAVALKDFMDRQKAKDLSPEDEKEVLDKLQKEEEAKAAIVEMANELNKEAENGEQ